MTKRLRRPCRICKATLYRFTTDGKGRMLEVYDPCVCQRRIAAGMCLNCDKPIDGVVGKSFRCAEHKKKARKAYVRKHYRKKKAEKGSSYISTTKRSHRKPEYRARQAARASEKHRERRHDPEYLKMREKYRLRGHPSYEKRLAYMKEYHARNREKKNEQTRERRRRLSGAT